MGGPRARGDDRGRSGQHGVAAGRAAGAGPAPDGGARRRPPRRRGGHPAVHRVGRRTAGGGSGDDGIPPARLLAGQRAGGRGRPGGRAPPGRAPGLRGLRPVSDLAPFLVVGVVAGSLYGLAGMGLVLTYQTSGILNFAHGAVAAAGAFAFYDLHFRHGLPWPLALLVSVLGIGVVAGAALERLARRLAGARPVLAVTATIGLLLAVQGLLTARYGLETRTFPTFLPTAGFRVAGVTITAAQVLTVAIALAAGAVLKISALGTAMRAVVDDPALIDLTGWSPVRVRIAAWMLGSAFAALSGIL